MDQQQPPRSIGFWGLALYTAAMSLSVRWLGTAAQSGPASLPIWALAAALFLWPLSIASAELTARCEGEGAVYAWTREAFGPFAGFLCAWLYWTCNLPYFSGLFVFLANILDVIAGGAGPLHGQAGFLIASISLVLVVAAMHLAGLGVGKWIPNLGALATGAVFAVLIGAGGLFLFTGRSATDFAHAAYVLPLKSQADLQNAAILWATFVFAFGGAEGVVTLRNEVKGGMKTIVGALFLVGALLTVAYVAGSIGMLSVLPQDLATRLAGLPDAIKAAFERIGWPWATPFALGFLALASLGGISSWFGVAARMPFAVGLDHMLPKAFGWRHPKTGAPVLSILVQTALVIVLIVLSQLKATRESAYDFLVQMTVLSYTLPFAFLFAAYFAFQSRQAQAGVWTAPKGWGRIIAAIGFLISLSAIVCSLVPTPDTPDPAASVAKLLWSSGVLIAVGIAVYVIAGLRAPKGRSA